MTSRPLALWLAVALALPALAEGDGGTALQHTVYGDPSRRDDAVAAAALQRVADEGRELFHDPRRLGSTAGIACAQCHPGAAATHAESYPKLHRGLQRVALLRDAINWCLVYSARGRALADGDPRLEALEVYLATRRAGLPLEPGKR